MGGGEYWYKEAIIYELHVKCFFDSSGDGIGDFNGLTKKLDYLQDLGVTAIWILPFYPSPLKDDGYDIADYNTVHPQYGELRDFKRFLREAHRRNLKVITELVINHTSDQHAWFQRARNAPPNSRYRNYYVWSETPDKYSDARIIFRDFEASNWAWDPVAKSYYWHRFYSHQPDLNFDNPEVQKEILKAMSFWLKMGVDGLRLDAIPYLYEREGTNCENLPETHTFLKRLRKYVDDHFPNRMFLAEANQWPEDAAKYFGEGDECHMAFHFPVMPRLFMSIHLEDSLPIMEIMGQTPEIPDSSQWALFLRNHDELTLEMVTDEERDYMFRVYAHDPQARINLGIRRRLAPLLKNDRRKIELMNSLLFSLTGTPVIYYGDELGMGDNIYLGDRNSVRTPMQWSSDRNAGFSRSNPQQLYLPPIIDPEYHYETVNVEAQINNPHSLLWWTKRLISLRKHYKALSYGVTKFLLVENRKILVFFREYEDELLMLVSNLSRHPQYVELDLKQFDGYRLVEMFSGERFPNIGELPYFLTLGPYGYYWFSLEKAAKEDLFELIDKEKERAYQEITVRHLPDRIFHPKMRRMLESILRRYLKRRVWFKPYLSEFEWLHIADQISIGDGIELIFVELHLAHAVVKILPLFLSFHSGAEAEERKRNYPENVVVCFQEQKKEAPPCILYDRSLDQEISAWLLSLMRTQKRLRTQVGEVQGISLENKRKSLPLLSAGADTSDVVREEQTILFPNNKGVVRYFWLLDEGVDLDVEMRLFLTHYNHFRNFLPLKGYVKYQGKDKTLYSLAEEMISVKKEFNAKQLVVEAANRSLVRMEASSEEIVLPQATMLQLAEGALPDQMRALLEEQLEVARLIGKTTGRFHKAMLSAPSNPDFSAIPFTLFYQRSLYQTIRRKVLKALAILNKHGHTDLFAYGETLLAQIQVLPHRKLSAQRTRYHGNLILENLHYTGKEFFIANFRGNPSYSYSERRYKRSPLIDVASMLYSLADASHQAIEKMHARGEFREELAVQLDAWANCWAVWIGSSFLRAYLHEVKNASFLPKRPEEIDFLLGIFLIEQCAEKIGEGQLDVPVRLWHHWLPIYEKVKLL